MAEKLAINAANFHVADTGFWGDFGQGKVWLVFFLCTKNKHYTIFLYLDG